MSLTERLEASAPPQLPASHHAEMQELGLRAVYYLGGSIEVQSCGCEPKREGLPADIVGADGKTLIAFRPPGRDPGCNGYDFAGWTPFHDGMNGGAYRDLSSALWWVRRAMDIRAGRKSDFIG